MWQKRRPTLDELRKLKQLRDDQQKYPWKQYGSVEINGKQYWGDVNQLQKEFLENPNKFDLSRDRSNEEVQLSLFPETNPFP